MKLFFILLLLSSPVVGATTDVETLDDVCFTPPSGCERKLVELLSKAKTIIVQHYELTSKVVLDAILAANDHGADIEVVLDKVTINTKAINVLAAKGVPIWIDSKHRIAHNKIIILDRKTVIGGSYNLTYSANYRNAENMVIMTSNVLAEKYLLNFEIHKNHSVEQ